jgi:SAM-dependent methyltransferase
MNLKDIEIKKRKLWESSIGKKDFVLDIGCWSGEKILSLLPQTENVYGMDITNKQFKFANSKIKKKLRVADVTKKIPFKIKFDYVILSEVLEHVEDDEKAIKNISNSLKKGGKLILTTPRSIKFFEIWDPAWFRWKFLGGQKHYHYQERELFEKLEENGFEIKEYYIKNNFIWVINRWINVILEYLFKSKKIYFSKESKGYFDWVILAEKK